MDEQIDIGMENFLSVEIDDRGHEDAADISQPTEIDSPTLKRKRLDQSVKIIEDLFLNVCDK